jgi:hypothetical protein
MPTFVANDAAMAMNRMGITRDNIIAIRCREHHLSSRLKLQDTRIAPTAGLRICNGPLICALMPGSVGGASS